MKKDRTTSVEELICSVRDFVTEREWEKYHNPKDLAESISIEAAELLQLFQWVTPEESQHFQEEPPKTQRIKEELADVVLYCLGMANTLNIDLSSAIYDKIEQNKKKYPVDLYKGKAHLD